MTTAQTSPVLIGRTTELVALRQAWAGAAQGRAQTVSIGGDAGVGKSRLLTELRPDVIASGGLWVLGTTPAQAAVAQPFAPLISALRSLLRSVDQPRRVAVIGPARAELARLVPELGDSATGPAAFDQMTGSVGRLFELVLDVFHRLAATQPAALIFEDLHWADRSTLDLVDFLARNLGGDRLLLVVTYRTDELHRRHPLRPVLAELHRLAQVTSLLLPPLTRDEVGELLAVLTGAVVADEVVDRVCERSSGLAFLVEELAAAGLDLDGIPRGLQDLLQIRVDTLAPDVADVVRAVAVGAAACTVPDDLLMAVTPMPAADLARRVREAVSHGVLTTGESGIDFRHALLREVWRPTCSQASARGSTRPTQPRSLPTREPRTTRPSRRGSRSIGARPMTCRGPRWPRCRRDAPPAARMRSPRPPTTSCGCSIGGATSTTLRACSAMPGR
ncbi:MAG: family ATPase [Acidimicrobiales bacterium]|nr:family ATPase [Acidimicrobiales bacterium]